jgi:NADH-quinone oxidoreductase subunit B
VDREEILKTLKSPAKWGQKYSLWAVYFCTGCGVVEIPPVITSRWDAERFGVIPMATPRQGNMFLITGYVSLKTLGAIIRTYDQIPDPKYVVGFGYWDSYNTIKQLDKYLPVDGWIAGCMPRPEAIFVAVVHLWQMIDKGVAKGYERYRENYEYYAGNQRKVLPHLPKFAGAETAAERSA